MSIKDMVKGHEEIARDIQQFMWEGKPFKSEKRKHTVEELEDFIESIRRQSWSNYDSGSKYLGWN